MRWHWVVFGVVMVSSVSLSGLNADSAQTGLERTERPFVVRIGEFPLVKRDMLPPEFELPPEFKYLFVTMLSRSLINSGSVEVDADGTPMPAKELPSSGAGINFELSGTLKEFGGGGGGCYCCFCIVRGKGRRTLFARHRCHGSGPPVNGGVKPGHVAEQKWATLVR